MVDPPDDATCIYFDPLDGSAGILSPLMTQLNQGEIVWENMSYIYSEGKSTQNWDGSVSTDHRYYS